MPSAALLPLADLPGVMLVGLQRPPLKQAPAGGLLDMDWGPDISDFAELAGVVAALDLLITVDKALAHLAGALGRPALVLLPRVPDWRWGLGPGRRRERLVPLAPADATEGRNGVERAGVAMHGSLTTLEPRSDAQEPVRV